MFVLRVIISIQKLLVMNLIPMILVHSGKYSLITETVKYSKYPNLVNWDLKNVIPPYLTVGIVGLNGVLVRELVKKPINGEDRPLLRDYLLVVNHLLLNTDLVI
jgi:hypothetical protein